ncbi:hypothetical protein C5L34_001139 [Lentilactobacillus hilgardii]|nr:hypothetical protein C5L34_001139 [Lentilactobacillus hilgardii]
MRKETYFRDKNLYIEYINGVIYLDDQLKPRLYSDQTISDFYELIERCLLYRINL